MARDKKKKFGESKDAILHQRITPTGLHGLQSLASQHGLTVSDLLEQIARSEIPLGSSLPGRILGQLLQFKRDQLEDCIAWVAWYEKRKTVYEQELAALEALQALVNETDDKTK